MHYAAECGHVECLKMLVDAGGRCDIKDDSGKDSLDLVTPGGRKLLERLSKYWFGYRVNHLRINLDKSITNTTF